MPAPSSEQAPAYCVACGAPEVAGACPRCAAPTADEGRTGRRRSSSVARWPRRAAVALLAVAALAGPAVAALAWSGARDADRRADRLAGLLAGLEERTADELDAVEAAVGRIERAVAGKAEPPDTVAVAEEALPSVLTVVAGEHSGSAWVVQRSGTRSTLVTNFHVVAGEWVNGRRQVRLLRGDATWEGTVTQVAEADDLALVEVGVALDVLPVRAEEARVGESVLALGSPLGLDGTTTTGIVSALREGFVQFSAPVGPGSSGGPLLDADGRVIGITVAKAVAEGAEGLSFAVPVARLCEALGVCVPAS